MNEIRERLREFIEYDEGKRIRECLHAEAINNYIPRNAGMYLEFVNKNMCSFTINHAQSTNHPYYLTMFCEKSQHVMGDCVEECLDKAIES